MARAYPFLYSIRTRCEPNLETPGATPAGWYRYNVDWLRAARRLCPAGTRLAVGAISPDFGGAWTDASIRAAVDGGADILDWHSYGNLDAISIELTGVRNRWRGPLLVTETNPGLGQPIDFARWAGDLDGLRHIAERLELLGCVLFSWTWDRPESPNAPNVKGSPVEAALARLNAEPVTPAPVTPTPTPPTPPGGGTVEFPFSTTLYNCPNHNAAPDTTRSLVVIHSTRSGRIKTADGKPWTAEHEFDTTASYMLRPDTVSADAVISPTRVGLMQSFGGPLVMWHGGYNNTRSRGYEICQATPTTPYADVQLRKTAWLVRQDCLRHGIPMRRVMDETQAGIIGHEDSAQGKLGGKSDPGNLFDWATFIRYVNDANLFAAAPPQGYNVLGFRAWLDAQPAGEYGAPRHDAREFGDGSGDLWLRLAPTPKHPSGPMLIYRKFWHAQTGSLLKAIRPVDWQ